MGDGKAVILCSALILVTKGFPKPKVIYYNPLAIRQKAVVRHLLDYLISAVASFVASESEKATTFSPEIV